MESQTQRLLALLKAGQAITPIEALRDQGVFRLAARIYDLRARGHRIEAERVDITDRFGRPGYVNRYRLAK